MNRVVDFVFCPLHVGEANQVAVSRKGGIRPVERRVPAGLVIGEEPVAPSMVDGSARPLTSHT